MTERQAAYIYSTVEAAYRMAATMIRLGFAARRVGSAIICNEDVYQTTITNAMAPQAEIVAEGA